MRKIARAAMHQGALIACLLASVPAWSGSFQVSPLRATLSASRTIEAFTVKNSGAEPAVVQLEVMSWSQDQGKDVYAASREIIATPPIFTVPAGGRQVVRVGLRRAPDPGRELTYRLYLQEVPPAPSPGFQGLQMALRVGIPVFVNPPGGAAPVLTWSARRAPGEILVSLANSGNAHTQVAGITLASARGEPVASEKSMAYVLPGRSREWRIKTSASHPAGMPLRLVAKTDTGEVEATLLLE